MGNDSTADSVLVQSADGTIAKRSLKQAIIQYFFELPNGLQMLLNSGETIRNILDAGAGVEDFYGLSYQGGTIFYLENNGFGLVASTSDQVIGAFWGCVGTDINGADGSVVGTGNTNTFDILRDCIDVSVAADWAKNYSDGIYHDWFLPSYEELELMYTNLHVNGLGDFFEIQEYHSSTEISATTTLTLDFSTGNQVEKAKNTGSRVRAIRAIGFTELIELSTPLVDLVNYGFLPYQLYEAGFLLEDILASGALPNRFPGGVQFLLDQNVLPLNILNAGAAASDFYKLNYQGGIIFYIEPGGTGLVASTNVLSTNAPWGCQGMDLPNVPNVGQSAGVPQMTTGALIGDGLSNTNNIVSDCLNTGTAAFLTKIYQDGSWFLPSIMELDEMYKNLDLGIGVFYWSSSEYDANGAWRQNMDTGFQNYNTDKNGTSRSTRAVKTF